jgi:TonB family protein
MKTVGMYRLAAVVYLAMLIGFGCVPRSHAQVSSIAHFVAPSFPPLARQTLISGQVTLTVTIDKGGSVTNVSEDRSAHPLLAQEAKACVRDWEFQPAASERKIAIIFYYGFSGNTREVDPKTTVKADFSDASVRVFITTDPAPTQHP